MLLNKSEAEHTGNVKLWADYLQGMKNPGQHPRLVNQGACHNLTTCSEKSLVEKSGARKRRTRTGWKNRFLLFLLGLLCPTTQDTTPGVTKGRLGNEVNVLSFEVDVLYCPTQPARSTQYPRRRTYSLPGFHSTFKFAIVILQDVCVFRGGMLLPAVSLARCPLCSVVYLAAVSPPGPASNVGGAR